MIFNTDDLAARMGQPRFTYIRIANPHTGKKSKCSASPQLLNVPLDISHLPQELMPRTAFAFLIFTNSNGNFDIFPMLDTQIIIRGTILMEDESQNTLGTFDKVRFIELPELSANSLSISYNFDMARFEAISDGNSNIRIDSKKADGELTPVVIKCG